MGQYEFQFPDVGEGIHEGTIVKWHVKKGDTVTQDQVLAEVETDKAVVEIPSPQAGKILTLHATAGAVIKVGDVMVTLEVKGAGKKATKKTEQKDAGGVVGALPQNETDLGVQTAAAPTKTTQKAKATSTTAGLATPFVRKMAQEIGIDISTINGTGNNGQVTAADVKAVMGIDRTQPKTKVSSPSLNTNLTPTPTAKNSKKLEISEKLEKQKASPTKPKITKKYDMWGYVDHIPLKGMRKAIATHMEESWQAPIVTHTDDADITELFNIREKEKINAKKKGIKLTYTAYMIKALIAALQKHPMLNAALDRENEDIIVKKYFNIGVAVDRGDGLVVPVVKGADKKKLFDIAKEIVELAEKAKAKKLDRMDMSGGTFTITNVGGLGGIYFTPLLNSPEVAILGIGKMMDKPVALNGKIVIRKILPLSLTFDHRVVDGAEAARFMTELIKGLASPAKL